MDTGDINWESTWLMVAAFGYSLLALAFLTRPLWRRITTKIREGTR